MAADLIRARFIHKVLDEEARKFYAAQTSRMEAVLGEKTGHLLTHRTVRALGGNGDFEGVVEFVHPAYERFLDMRHVRGQKKGHRRRIHNTPIMKTYNRIAERLLFDFTEATQEALRGEIEQIRASFGK